ncbi:MAG: DEAD/DEAH box helicase, partial [Rhodobacteraceae bacterium]|nr:DEAD/DEAH box helicase [Paracoccaceae bacterium]
EDYVHRIGRTGRAGRSGKAFTIATPSDDKYLAAIESLLQKKLPRGEAPASYAEAAAEVASRPERKTSTSRSDRGERSRRGSYKPRGGASEADTTAATVVEAVREIPVRETVAAAAPAAEVVSVASARDDGRTDRSRGRRDRHREDAPVVGMGDHVPDFLMREFRAKAG